MTTLSERATRAINNLLDSRDARAERAGQLLTAFSYRATLSRGFALVRDSTGQPVRMASAVQPGMALDVEFADGRVGATAEGVSKRVEYAPAPRRRPRKPGGGDTGQGSLFG
jgi:exodeoxyribonuclease VII large subunit